MVGQNTEMLSSFGRAVETTILGILIDKKSDSASLGVSTVKQHLEKKKVETAAEAQEKVVLVCEENFFGILGCIA